MVFSPLLETETSGYGGEVVDFPRLRSQQGVELTSKPRSVCQQTSLRATHKPTCSLIS